MGYILNLFLKNKSLLKNVKGLRHGRHNRKPALQQFNMHIGDFAIRVSCTTVKRPPIMYFNFALHKEFDAQMACLCHRKVNAAGPIILHIVIEIKVRPWEILCRWKHHFTSIGNILRPVPCSYMSYMSFGQPWKQWIQYPWSHANIKFF